MTRSAISALLIALTAPTALAGECKSPDALGVSRIVEIDAAAGPLYGELTSHAKEPSFLGPKEVVLTFDDGPMPWVTKSILDTLDRFCTKATFFSVGKMAVAYPATVRDTIARGHTIGGHTWSHPLNLPRMKIEKARDEIERGFAAIEGAAGQPIAPFFRFTGLADSGPLLAYLQTRGIASFTVDVVSNDSYIGDQKRLISYTLNQLEQRKRGIMLFHDIKAATAKALPAILSELKARGYKVVHLRPKKPLEALADHKAQLAPQLAKAEKAAGGTRKAVPFFGTTGPEKVAAATAADDTAGAPVTTLSPQPRERPAASAKKSRRDKGGEIGIYDQPSATRVVRRRSALPALQPATAGTWSTFVDPTTRWSAGD